MLASEMKKKVCENLSSTSSHFSLTRFVYRNICKLFTVQSSHNSLCQQFRSLNSQARASPDHVRFTISSKSPETVFKTADELKQKLWELYGLLT